MVTITNKYKITIKKILHNIFRSCQKHCWLYSAFPVFRWIYLDHLSFLIALAECGGTKRFYHLISDGRQPQNVTQGRDTGPWRQGRVFVLDTVFQRSFLLAGRRPLVRRRWHLKTSICWLLIDIKTDRRYRKFRLAPRRWWERDLFKTTRRKYLLLFFFQYRTLKEHYFYVLVLTGHRKIWTQ